eukprot:CAMPEP_0201571744 /NCGR_PEP_ID=MMETSP0190_2-20130828/14688_1 /ASSEMBLY_ACC=CAM_ASM_000263 /TAXON_ID=37353 /ORGANISM="Rosalina sp." /LENGTH=361 /DNA_ID=CAMNT_0047996737 /DNA_START=23 /DNA_END=1108 /DNA_ORIENTATION=+
MASEISDEALEDAEMQLNQLGLRIQQQRESQNKTILSNVSDDAKTNNYKPSKRREYPGHFGKIYALQWGSDSKTILTASQDGKLILWNPLTGNKYLAVSLDSSWVMACAFSPSCKFVASGGLDNTITVHTTYSPQGQADIRYNARDVFRSLEKHNGYVSCVKFVGENELLSSSGDGTTILWDVEKADTTTTFTQNTSNDPQDVMSIDINPKTPNLFVSSSVGGMAKIWDMRATNKAIMTFRVRGNQDMNDLDTTKWFIDGEGIITGGADGVIRLFDMKCYAQINEYNIENMEGVTCVDVSYSGRYIYGSYDGEGKVCMFNTLSGEKILNMQHPNRVGTLAVSPNGQALATGAWDAILRMYA